VKTCLKCKEEADLSSFSLDKSRKDGLSAYCKPCRKEKAKEQYKAHTETIKNRVSEYRLNNPDKYKEAMSDYYRTNATEVKARVKTYRLNNKEKVAASKIQWARDNAGKMREARKRSEAKNPHTYKMRRRMKDMLRRTLQMTGEAKKEITSDVFGYSANNLKSHLENQFVAGMNWGNYGLWHIDHKKPIIAFLNEGCIDPSIINALSNLAPLWAKDNMSKGAKWISS